MEAAEEDELDEDEVFPLLELLFDVPDDEDEESRLVCFDKRGLNKEN